ncbi:30S ribosomal protein S13 [Patescibacteria group bacterium]|nr:30S ribosomal protein S13 [Patescibacteria group bacterium]
MARISGINIPNDKTIEYALTSIYGIGLTRSRKILKQARADLKTRTSDINEQDLSRISRVIDNSYKVEGELRMQVRDNIRRLKAIGTYRGSRHKKKLPCRGQKTRCNARTTKGRKRMAVGGLSSKKKAAKAKT